MATVATPDPRCAVCGGEAQRCEHETDRMKLALQEAQARWLAGEQMHLIRHWVLSRARSTIQSSYATLAASRRAQYDAHLLTLPFYNLYRIYADGAPLPPHQLGALKSQMRGAWEHMQRQLDDDWRNCLSKYPETLDYFFAMVEVGRPVEEEVAKMGCAGQMVRRRGRSKGRRRWGSGEGFAYVEPGPVGGGPIGGYGGDGVPLSPGFGAFPGTRYV